MDDSEQQTPPAPEAPARSLGEILRSARLEQDLTLEQLAAELRIEAKQLNALEQDRFEQIGVPVFVKGYLKQYGMRLGLSVSDLLALYYKQTTLTDVQIQPNRTIKLRDDRQITSWVFGAIVLLSVVVGLAVWWWNGGTFSAEPLTRSASAPAAPAQAETTPAPRLAAPPAARPEPSAAVEAAPAASPPETPAGEAEQSAATAPAGDSADDSAVPTATIPLEFSFEQESWAEVTDTRGERLLFGLNAAGRRVTVRGEPPFSIVLGNADAVRLVVDGEPYPIPTVGRQGNLARFAVDIAEE